MRSLIAATLAASLVAAPVAAAPSAPASSAASLRIGHAVANGSQMEGDNTWIYVGLGVVALGIFLILVLDDNNNDSTSP